MKPGLPVVIFVVVSVLLGLVLGTIIARLIDGSGLFDTVEDDADSTVDEALLCVFGLGMQRTVVVRPIAAPGSDSAKQCGHPITASAPRLAAIPQENAVARHIPYPEIRLFVGSMRR